MSSTTFVQDQGFLMTSGLHFVDILNAIMGYFPSLSRWFDTCILFSFSPLAKQANRVHLTSPLSFTGCCHIGL